MNNEFLASLIGPFEFSKPPMPDRKGWYIINIDSGESAYFDGSQWFYDDDGLSDPLPPETLAKHRGWWGQVKPGSEPVDDGLGGEDDGLDL